MTTFWLIVSCSAVVFLISTAGWLFVLWSSLRGLDPSEWEQ